MSEQERDEFEGLLPDAANNKLSAVEQARFSALLTRHPGWQSDLDALEALRHNLQAYPELELPADRWKKLAARLAETRVVIPVAPVKSRWQDWLDAFNRPWIAAAALVVVIAQGLFILPFSIHGQPVEYRGSDANAAQWKASFKGEITEAQMRDLLLRARFEIVSGPSVSGEYGLAPQSESDIELLRQSKLILKLQKIQH